MSIDAEELGELLDRYWPTLVAWVGEAHWEAEDVVQKAFIKLAAEEPVPNNCVAWLFKVTKRLAINERLAFDKRRSREAKSASERRQGDCVHSQSLDLELKELLSKLDGRQREVVIARVWGELTFDEIAAALNEPKASVWRVYQAGIAELKNLYRREASE